MSERATPDTTEPAKPNEVLDRYDAPVLRAIEAEQALAASTGIPRAMFIPQSYGEAIEMAKMMCAGIGVPVHLRGSPANCMAVLMQASRWGLDPYAVACKSYFVNDVLAYEAQLVNAVVNTSGALHGRLKVRWQGQDNALRCTVEGHIKGDDEMKALSQAIARVKVKNSPLWIVNPEQQLAYLTTRAWARLYIPEVLLGVYTPDEIIEGGVVRPPAPAALHGDEPLPATRQAEDAPRREHFTVSTAKPAATSEDTAAAEADPKPEEVNRVLGPVPEGYGSWDSWADGVATKMKTAATLPRLDAVVGDTQALFDQAPDEVRQRLGDLYEEKATDHREAAK